MVSIAKKIRIGLFHAILCSVFFGILPLWASSQQLGASLYIAPPNENPRAESNFSLAIKVDSLAQPINAISGVLVYNQEKLEIINVSKIGSIINLWVEEPQFSNLEGKLKFQGGVPKPGFIGNGGNVLLIIFRAKTSGVVSLVWEKGSVYAADGEGTNILTDLHNLSFQLEESIVPGRDVGQGTPYIWGIIGISFLTVGYFILKLLLERHDIYVHKIFKKRRDRI